MLFTRGALVAGETVLVVGSGGGVNSLTIQMSARLGCTVIALAGGKQKAERALSLGATYAIDYSTSPEWYREVHRLTNRRGVDLALDNVGEKTMEQSLRSLRWGGRLVTVGNTSGWNVSVDNRLIFAKQLSILGSTMGSRGDFESAQKFLRQHAIEPVIDTVAPLSEGIHQIQRLERGEHFGKIVLLPSA
jgi:NADPH:quinone reductase-like Zn-dependent oxidoreductase